MSNLKKTQKIFGLSLEKELEIYNWQVNTMKKDYYVYQKNIDTIQYRWGFALTSRNPYLIFASQCVVFLDLTQTIQTAFSHILSDDELYVVVDMDYEHIEVTDLRIDKDNPTQYTAILAKRIANAENNLFPKYANHEYILKQNDSPRHWEWLTKPYLSYALYMIGYGLHYNQPVLISTAFERLQTIKSLFSAHLYHKRNIEIADKLFLELGFS